LGVVIVEATCPWCGKQINISPAATKFCPVCKMPIRVIIKKRPDGVFEFEVVQDRRKRRKKK